MLVCILYLEARQVFISLVDRTGERFFHITAWWAAVILGFIIALSTMSIPARYVAMFLMASGYAGAILDFGQLTCLP